MRRSTQGTIIGFAVLTGAALVVFFGHWHPLLAVAMVGGIALIFLSVVAKSRDHLPSRHRTEGGP